MHAPVIGNHPIKLCKTTQFVYHVQHYGIKMCKGCPTPLQLMGQINKNYHHSQDIVASVLKLPANKVMCHVKRAGGSFGGKTLKTGIMAAITAFAANK